MVEIVDNWFGAEGERDGMPTFMRGRGELQPLIGLPSHPNLLRITWEFEPEDPSGLPSPALQQRMMGFEEAFMDPLEEEPLCIFYFVYLHDGAKEWSAYCSDIERTGQVFNAAVGLLLGYREDGPSLQRGAGRPRGLSGRTDRRERSRLG
jgi:hypothetical protein